MTTPRMLCWRTPWMAWWLAMALVLAPALGRMHEVLHLSQLGSTAAAVSHQADVATQGKGDGHAPAWLAAWWDGHAQADCLALDQLSHALDHGVQALPLLHALPQAAAQPGAGWHWLPIPTVAFQARGPPQRRLA